MPKIVLTEKLNKTRQGANFIIFSSLGPLENTEICISNWQIFFVIAVQKDKIKNCKSCSFSPNFFPFSIPLKL